MHATRACLRGMFPCVVQVQPGNYLLTVHAKPCARVSGFAAPLTPSLAEADLRIAAPPVEGQANAELLRYLNELVEHGFRAMKADHAGYVKDTSYSQVLAADVAADAPPAQSVQSRKVGEKKPAKKGRPKNATEISAATSSKASLSEAVLPSRIEVSLVRGSMSREKTVLVVFPGTRAQLTAVLEKESRT
ncbi:hypothetical protein LSCM1_02172 [Leishmania martiniquensis]|uniref:Uncharacterized protein n=1 Tax=Leishmania martiniquensis TaxID=1580590 RepID=A0A836G559_9TRYP|nr:hypothetical protein LSCM1_02172 [Leishmania martiniquensis]